MSKMPNLVAYSAQLQIDLEKELDTNMWQRELKAYFDSLSYGCEEVSVDLIGHIKGFLSLNQNGYGYFSTVGAEKGTCVKGNFIGKTSKGVLDFNVLVYGSEDNIINKMVQEKTDNLCHGLGGKCILKLPSDI